MQHGTNWALTVGWTVMTAYVLVLLALTAAMTALEYMRAAAGNLRRWTIHGTSGIGG